MQDNRSVLKSPLPVILVAAVVQGWALYFLHQSIEHSFWPGTHAAWLTALYAVVIVAPLTIQVLSEHAKSKALWMVVATISLAYFYFAWHFGSSVYGGTPKKLFDSGDFFPSAFTMGVLWLLVLPFMQLRLSSGRWSANYTALFTTAWRNKLMLAEAGAFTGLFWLLLALWGTLFKMLGIMFFRDLFQEPIFVYPVTTIAFGIALHLIGSVERLTAAILEQMLNVLKWLALVAGFILAIFTLALVFKLPGLLIDGQKAIGAAWLLWLVAVMVLLINAAYRDGTIPKPYPTWIAFGLRCVIPTTIIVALTALYALAIRAHQYGVTIERVWGLIVASVALCYSVGYAIASFEKTQWLKGVGRTNVIVALAMIATIIATLTPIMSPYRLSANSQYRIALASPADESAKIDNWSSLSYLRFHAGNYGMKRLRELTTLQDHPHAKEIRTAALQVIESENRWRPQPIDTKSLFDDIIIYPSGRTIEDSLRVAIEKDLEDDNELRLYQNAADESAVGLFVDMDNDKLEEFVLLTSRTGHLYRRNKAGDAVWQFAANVQVDGRDFWNWRKVLTDVNTGDIEIESPEWQQLSIGKQRYRVAPRE